MKPNRFNLRAWSKTRHVMCGADFSSQLLHCIITGKKYISDGTDDPNHLMDVDSFILMQSTGLVDAAGKEIFEGDILTCSIQPSYGVYSDQRLWDGHTFAVEFMPHFAGMNVTKNTVAVCKVIGNIYENPELLKRR